MSAEARARVIAEAHTWLRTPYHHMGRIKGVGVDCATLLCEVFEAAGVTPHIDPTPYPPDWHFHRDEERYLEWIKKAGGVEVEEPRPGDVIVWKFGRCFSHAAILCDDGYIIHSYIGQGVRLDRRDSEIFLLPTGGKRDVKYFTLWADE